MITTHKYIIPPVYIESGEISLNGIRLRRFQEELYYELKNHDKICLKAPTGSGKTFTIFTLLFHAWKLRRPIIGLYPSRELVKDQSKSVVETLKKMGLTEVKDACTSSEGKSHDACTVFKGKLELTKNGKVIDVVEGEIDVVTLTSETSNDVFQFLDNYQPFQDGVTRYLILLTVPEYPYMYITHLGVMKSFGTIIEAVVKGNPEAIKGKKTEASMIFNKFALLFNGYYFIDEFHLYTGLSRSSLKLLVKMIDDYNVNRKPKYVFSSATPVNVECEKTIEVKPSSQGDQIRKENLVVFHLTTSDPQEEIVKNVDELLANVNGKVGIIVDRVYYIVELCDKIQASVVWGLDNVYGKCYKSNDIRNEKIIVGNHAISFGIDIPNLDFGIIHAHDVETLIQRVGRFGRHGTGRAEIHIFLKAPAISFPSSVDYLGFLSLAEKMYKKRVDDKLDQIEFAKIREEVVFNVYLTLKKLANSQNVELTKMNVDLPTITDANEYFNIFAFRPGGIKGRWCNNKDKTDDFFTLIRNFEYDYENDCFKDIPLKQIPEIVINAGSLKGFENKLMKVENFFKRTHARIILRSDGGRGKRKIELGRIRPLNDAFVIPLKHDLWKNFSDIARLVSTYAPAIVACEGINKVECENVNALLLFL
ncbi:DEAD/DEAH box helicase [Sulfolobus tengchongensis]|uniref:DEAD/DEAH box helicase n=1 Tax=Sulfolobus tengchongensis TaxID=207809 RepID=A0AAX4L2L0_9CREN